MEKVIGGYLGGMLIVDEQDNVTAFFCERFVTGSPCDVRLGPVIDDLLALNPGEHLKRSIAGIDDIYARRAPESLKLDHPEVVLYVLSSFRHSTNMIIVSQEKLRQTVSRAIMAV